MGLRHDAKWAMVTPTSMGVRITPEDGQPVHVADRFLMQVTSAETNVASVLSYLGMPVKVLTNFVAGSPIAFKIKSDLASRHMSYEGPDIEPGSAWGYRHQFNIADSGYGNRGARVWNDRAGEVGRTLNVKDFDLERIFGDEGVKIVHMTGVVAALSEDSTQFCLEAARTAKKYGTAVGFDLNYRASFWEGREAELRESFTEIASLADILVGNEEDFQLALGLEGPEAGGKGIDGKIDGFKGMIELAHKTFPHASWFATTLREVINTNRHNWGVLAWNDGDFHLAEPREIGVLDRVGGGDATIGGLMYGIANGWDAEKCVQFAWSAGALKATMLTDYIVPADEEQIWSIWEGNARIKR